MMRYINRLFTYLLLLTLQQLFLLCDWLSYQVMRNLGRSVNKKRLGRAVGGGQVEDDEYGDVVESSL